MRAIIENSMRKKNEDFSNNIRPFCVQLRDAMIKAKSSN